jgi:genome maintenance exonuclease 1
MLLKPRYDYGQLSRTTIDGRRHYCLPDGSRVPSVTTILEVTKPEEKKRALNEWRQRVGVERAQQITTEAANVGTVMHKKLEQYCLGTLEDPGSNHIQRKAHDMAQLVIRSGLKELSECWGVEVPLFYSGLYAGTTDCLGVWRAGGAVLDFKQTNRPKKKEWIDDYFLQLAAYIQAHDHTYGTQIERGAILMCSRDCEYQEFVIEGAELELWKNRWWDRVEQFYAINR